MMIDKALQEAELFNFFEPELLIYSSVVGIKKDYVLIFCFAADRAGMPHDRDRCMFVGKSSKERIFASAAGSQVSQSLDQISS